ncbi:hypothetical protein [Phytohabitans flavus]|uniref:hypothetical protein n=1 Tax=Phytohabitans flavus TaxID=1076124 RepID=UPI001E49C3C8|nr:hypothetical protein [Phytohabitans flavus]
MKAEDMRHVRVPGVGDVAVPPPEKIAFYAGIGVLAAFEVVDWPVAGVIIVGHLLADQRHFARLRGFGEAAESA